MNIHDLQRLLFPAVFRRDEAVYRRLVEEADDLGKGNPMAYNALFALASPAVYRPSITVPSARMTSAFSLRAMPP